MQAIVTAALMGTARQRGEATESGTPIDDLLASVDPGFDPGDAAEGRAMPAKVGQLRSRVVQGRPRAVLAWALGAFVAGQLVLGGLIDGPLREYPVSQLPGNNLRLLVDSTGRTWVYNITKPGTFVQVTNSATAQVALPATAPHTSPMGGSGPQAVPSTRDPGTTRTGDWGELYLSTSAPPGTR